MRLTNFLLARISEDERDARESADLDGDYFDSNHQGRWTPQRVLAECEAKRRIVEEHEPVDYSGFGMRSPNACSTCGADLGMSDWEWDRDSFPCDTLRALALPYADHPDYREEWKP